MRFILPRLLALGLACALMPSCSRAPSQPPVPGVTTVAQLQQTYGTPAHESAAALRPQAKLMDFQPAQGAAFQAQVEDGVVLQINREPTEPEASLQYWRHLWKGTEQRYQEIGGTKDPHGHALFQLISVKNHEAVVYDPARDRVLRVVEYGRR